MYDVERRNSIRVDGQPVSAYDPVELRRLIGIVSQEPTIFHGSIKDNIVYGEWGNVTDDQILAAAKQAHVMEFAQDFTMGLDTMVGPRTLSGGQRQRIAIARVLLKNPPILIFDEASSQLDARSEHIIEEAMKVVMRGRTVLSIAHRLSTIRNATRIAVVDDGSVVQEGTFRELSMNEGPFRQLMKTQL
jgi:ABC-type multidrug transport system fused ATPase/permease subunit